MAWTDTSDTCVAIFSTLGRLHQIDEHTTFEAAGPMTMKELQFFNVQASSDITAANALALARLINEMMINGYDASCQPGLSSDDAVQALTGILQDGDKTIENLSDSASAQYSLP